MGFETLSLNVCELKSWELTVLGASWKLPGRLINPFQLRHLPTWFLFVSVVAGHAVDRFLPLSSCRFRVATAPPVSHSWMLSYGQLWEEGEEGQALFSSADIINIVDCQRNPQRRIKLSPSHRDASRVFSHKAGRLSEEASSCTGLGRRCRRRRRSTAMFFLMFLLVSGKKHSSG